MVICHSYVSLPEGTPCYDWAGPPFSAMIVHQNLNFQGLVSVPFWEYWTSPYSSHYRLYTQWLGDVQWGHLMTHDFLMMIPSNRHV